MSNDGYVHVRFTPREAKIISMILTGSSRYEIAEYFSIDLARVDQIIKKARSRIDLARAKMATEAANKPCTVRSQEVKE